MADIRLAKPAAGTSQNVVCTPDARFVFEFPTDEATLSRNGDNLVITFEDGSTIQLENFYTAYSSENMPSFSVDGAEISGEDFFTAMNEPDLMPAAGPAGNAGNQSNGNRFHDYVNADLLDGLDRLGGLDIGWPGSDVNPETDGAATSGDYVDIDYGVTVTPGDPGIDDTPVIDNPDNPNDNPPAGVVADRDVLRVQESNLADGTNPNADALSADGFMNIDAPDGVASITIGSVTVFENGALTGAKVPTDEGYLEVTGFDPVTGRLDYTYHLTGSTQEHEKDTAADDSIAHELPVTVTDTDGSTGSSVITVVITDDGPVLNDLTAPEVADTANVITIDLPGFDVGADVISNNGENTPSTVEVKVGDKAYTFTVSEGENGYVFTPENGQTGMTISGDRQNGYKLTYTRPEVDVQGNASDEYGFTVKITDSDGDFTEKSVTVTTTPSEPSINVDTPKLKTDESYIQANEDPTQPAGSQKAPDGGEGSSASSNTDSGTLTVDTHGQKGTLIITVGGKPYSVDLNADGTLARNQSTSFDTQYGTITLANGEDGITYTYTQTKNFIHSDEEPNNPDEAVNAESESFTVQVQDSNGNTSESQTITVTIEDDAPVFTEESSSYQEVTNSEEYWTSTDTIYFSNTNLSGNNDELTLSNGDRLSFQVGHIKFDEDRQGVSKDNITLDTNGTIYIDKDNGLGIHTESDRADRYWDSWGREQTKVDNDPLDTVDDNILNDRDHNQGRLDEIGYDWELNQAEAIIIDLQGKTAINMHITLNGFKSDPHGEGVEKAIFIFYKDGEIVATKTLDGTTQATFTDMPAGGFDKVVIAAMHNGTSQGAQTDNSDFAIGSITFNEFDNPPVRTLTGDLEANSADGIKSYGIDVQALADLGLTSEGAPIIYSWNDSGTLVASANGETVFELSLNTDTGAWTLIQYQEYDGNLNLPFTATDGDGDVTSLDIAIGAATTLDVHEAGLEGGSDGDAEVTAFGSLNIDEGATSISIEEGKITLDNPVGKTITFGNGDTFIVKEYKDGVLSYEYILRHPETHGDDDNSVVNKFTISVNKENEVLRETVVNVNIHDDNMSELTNEYNSNHSSGIISAESADGVTYSFDTSSYGRSWRIESNGDTQTLTKAGLRFSVTLNTKTGEWSVNMGGGWLAPDELYFTATNGDGDQKELSVSIRGGSGWLSAQSVEHNVTSAATAAAAVGMLAAMPDTVEASESISPVEEMDDVSITPETTNSVSSTAENAPEIGIDNNTVEASDTLAALMDETAWADDNGGLLFDKLDALDADGLMSFADNLESQTRQSDEVGTDDSAAMNDTEATESLAAVSGDGVLLGDDEDNQLFGGEGDDYLFGMNGNDYLDGGEGSDYIFAGSGDDVIVYDGSDYLIDGGDGIDFMVSTDEGLSLDKLLTESGRDGNDGPIVNDVEVLITGKDALSLTNTEQLAKEYGITIGTGTNGDETLTLDMSKWQDNGNGSFDYIGQEGVDLTLETNLTPVPDTGDAEVQTQVFILNNTQG